MELQEVRVRLESVLYYSSVFGEPRIEALPIKT
jgi:hypothetical protein